MASGYKFGTLIDGLHSLGPTCLWQLVLRCAESRVSGQLVFIDSCGFENSIWLRRICDRRWVGVSPVDFLKLILCCQQETKAEQRQQEMARLQMLTWQKLKWVVLSRFKIKKNIFRKINFLNMKYKQRSWYFFLFFRFFRIFFKFQCLMSHYFMKSLKRNFLSVN